MPPGNALTGASFSGRQCFCTGLQHTPWNTDHGRSRFLYDEGKCQYRRWRAPYPTGIPARSQGDFSMSKHLSRRTFLKSTGVALTGALLAACAPVTPSADGGAAAAAVDLEIWTFVNTHARWFRSMGEDYQAEVDFDFNLDVVRDRLHRHARQGSDRPADRRRRRPGHRGSGTGPLRRLPARCRSRPGGHQGSAERGRLS